MLRILAMTPNQVDNPALLRQRQDEILAGFPAFILHPGIDEGTVDDIGNRTFRVHTRLYGHI